MSKGTTTGAKWLRNERRDHAKKPVCTSHVMRTSEITRLKSGAVKRTKLGDL